MKKTIVIILIAVILLPVIFYVGIVNANNHIAEKIEKDLLKYELPNSTEIIDSVSLTGKLNGNGNGMQYVGVLLVESELSEEAIKEHYSAQLDYVEVVRQEDSKLDFIEHGDYSYDGFPGVEGKSYYSVVCYDSNRSDAFGFLLDLDLRGH